MCNVLREIHQHGSDLYINLGHITMHCCKRWIFNHTCYNFVTDVALDLNSEINFPQKVCMYSSIVRNKHIDGFHTSVKTLTKGLISETEAT